jgi:hypothetical protein
VKRKDAVMETVANSNDGMQAIQVWFVRGAAVVAVVALLAISAPLLWAAVSAGLGIAALAGMAAVGFAFLQSVPLGLQKLENKILALRKAEARQNPIEQLQNDCFKREERLQSFRRALVTIGGQIESMRQMVDDRRHSDPEHILDRQDRALHRMKHFYSANIQRLEEAQIALEAFKHQVKQKMFEWEFAQAGKVVMAALNPRELEDLMQDLLTDEALREVQSRFNNVFAELDVEMRSMSSPTHDFLQRNDLETMEALTLPEISAKRKSK